MATVFVGTCIDEKHFRTALVFLGRLPIDPDVTWFCVTLGFAASSEIMQLFKHVQFYHQPRAALVFSNIRDCMLHSTFLSCMTVAEDDVVVVIDADSVVQRKLSDKERARFLSYSADTFGVAWNAGPSDTLAAEFFRLSPKLTISQMESQFGLLDRPVFNTTMLVAKPTAFRRLYDEYDREWPRFAVIFDHSAKNQWLLSWLLASRGFQVDTVGFEFHAHGYYGMPQQCRFRKGTLCYAEQPDRCDEVVVFVRHHMPVPEDLTRLPHYVGNENLPGKPEPLDLIALRTGTDKGTAWHGYSRLYEHYLLKYEEPCLLLEIGVGEGASIAMWRQWRPLWRVFGIDVNPRAPADFHGDGADINLLPPDLRFPDIVIDDGSHNADDVIKTFLAWWPHLKPGGLYVVEDLHCSYHERYNRPWERRPVDFLVSLIHDCMENGSGLDGAFKRKLGDASEVDSIHFHKSIAFIFKANGS